MPGKGTKSTGKQPEVLEIQRIGEEQETALLTSIIAHFDSNEMATGPKGPKKLHFLKKGIPKHRLGTEVLPSQTEKNERTQSLLAWPNSP